MPPVEFSRTVLAFVFVGVELKILDPQLDLGDELDERRVGDGETFVIGRVGERSVAKLDAVAVGFLRVVQAPASDPDLALGRGDGDDLAVAHRMEAHVRPFHLTFLNSIGNIGASICSARTDFNGRFQFTPPHRSRLMLNFDRGR